MSQITFRTVCFSTNFSNYSSISIVKQYLMIADCTDIHYLKDNHLQFKHKLLLENGSKIEYNNSYYEISSFSKSSSACEKADCFIIFFDLENNESNRELNKILKFINETCVNERKIFLINFYTTESNIKDNFTDEYLKNTFSNNNLNSSQIYRVNMDSSEELAKVIDSLSKEVLEDKKMIGNKLLDFDNSKSNCIVI